MKIQHIAIAVFVAAIWGFNFVIVKVGLAEMPPFVYGAGRFMIALIPIVFFIKHPPSSWKLISGIGFTLGFIKFALMFSGIQMGLSAGLASLVLQSQVFFTVALSVIIFKSDVTFNQIVGMALAFLGIIIIGIEMHAQSTLLGLMLLIGSAFSWAVSNILYRKAGNVDMFSLTIWSSLIPPIPMLLCSYYMEGPDAAQTAYTNMTWVGLACLVYTTCGSTWIGATLWGVLLRNYDAPKVAPYSLLIPVFGISSACLFLGEELSTTSIAACGIVFLGLLVNQWSRDLRYTFRPKAYTPVESEIFNKSTQEDQKQDIKAA